MDSGKPTEAALISEKFINTTSTPIVGTIGSEVVSDKKAMKMVIIDQQVECGTFGEMLLIIYDSGWDYQSRNCCLRRLER